ncbi:MAG: hypothetical protein UW18_C0011G0019 [Microgenomates group bacterium GW2011_GWF1_44_10]|nr:MAG: hypothetical protein UW18_C0011G0019 [Microgenomates group bacterium GW2011_GWF1_44_10]
MSRKLAIVGTHPATRNNAPFDDPSVDIWVFNESPMATKEYYPNEPDRQWCKRWDACIQLHKPEVYKSLQNWVNPKHWEWLQREHGDKVIYMQDVDENVPNSRKYPLDEIVATIPGANLKWFTASVSYALALAIYQGYEEIGLYGLDMESNTEYGYQLMNFVYWIGIAYGRGINLYEICNKKYFSEKLYGYEGEIQIDREHFSKRFAELLTLWRDKEKESGKLRSRVTDAILEHKYPNVIPLTLQWRSIAIDAGRFSGAMQEAENYSKREDMISRQEFERRAAQAAKDGEEQKALMYLMAGKAEYVFNAWQQTGQYQPLEQLRKFIEQELKLAYNVGALHGAYQENLEYIAEYDNRLEAAGGVRTLSAMTGESKDGS